jgi:hypothetical protein
MRMMIFGLALASGVASAAPATGGDGLVSRQCDRALAKRSYPNRSSPAITSVVRSGRTSTVRGTFTAELRPAAGLPGELTPAHIQLLTYGFTCVVRGQTVRKLVVRPN